MKLKAVIFGVGSNYKKYREELNEKYNIVSLVDNNRWDDVIKRPSYLRNIDYDVVVITPTKYGEMYDQLIDIGIAKEKILVLDLDADRYKKVSRFHEGHSYSEFGEDIVVAVLFEKMRIQHPSYMDLGANHPFIASNTAIFYETGSTGIVVEANPKLIKAFYISHPKDVVLNTGVSTEIGNATFYMINDVEGRNSFSKDEIDRWGLPIAEILKLPTITLDEIVEQHCPKNFPDFLSCDIEGKDYAVLQGYDLLNQGPKMICVEVRWKDISRFDKLLDEKGYSCFCRLGENQIYVKNEYQLVVCNSL